MISPDQQKEQLQQELGLQGWIQLEKGLKYHYFAEQSSSSLCGLMKFNFADYRKLNGTITAYCKSTWDAKRLRLQNFNIGLLDNLELLSCVNCRTKLFQHPELKVDNKSIIKVKSVVPDILLARLMKEANQDIHHFECLATDVNNIKTRQDKLKVSLEDHKRALQFLMLCSAAGFEIMRDDPIVEMLAKVEKILK